MSKEKRIEKELHFLLKLKTFDIIMFASVRVIQNALPSVTLKEAILNFMNTFEITEEQWSLENATQTYYRILHKLKKEGLWN